MLTLFIVAMMIPWNLSGASAADATPSDQPAQEEPATSTEVPVSTEIPAEPTATDVPVEPTAASTQIPTEVPTEVTESDFESAANIPVVFVYFFVCEDDARIGTADMQWENGEFSGAGTAENCRAASDVYPDPSATVTLTNINTDDVYNFDLTGDTGASKYDEVIAGIYEVSYTSFAGSRTFPEQLALTGYDYEQVISIQEYVAESAPVLPAPDDTDVDGLFLSCRDVTRAETTDFEIASFSAASSADLCVAPMYYGSVTITISGTTAEGTPYGPVSTPVENDGLFEFNDLPAGTYTLTESVYGNSSEEFVVVGGAVADTYFTVRIYYGTTPEYNPTITVSLITCHDVDRAGTVDYVSVIIDGYLAADSCIAQFDPLDDPLDLTVRDAEGTIVDVIPLQGNFDTVPLDGPNTSGSYTIQLEGYAESEPFVIGNSQIVQFVATLYVNDPIEVPEPGVGEGAIGVTILHCTSAELEGQIDYVINQDFGGVAQGECEASLLPDGAVFLFKYANTGDTEPESVTLLSSFLTETFSIVDAGYYRLGYSDSSFVEPTELSEEFVVEYGEATVALVYVYTAPVDTSTLIIRKDICYNDDKALTTEFFVQQGDSLLDGLLIATDDTTECRVATALDGTFTFILTDVNTGASISTAGSSTSILPVAIGSLSGVPSGTYTMTEVVAGVTRTSDPFTIDASAGDYSVLVRNYLEGDIPDLDGDGGQFILWAYDCINDAKAGTSEFFYNPGIVGDINEFPGPQGGGFASSAEDATTENCVASDQYEFQLEGDEIPEGFSAAAVYPMISGASVPGVANDDFGFIYTSSIDGFTPANMPAGEYVIRETTTGSLSEPIFIGASTNIGGFYRFAAAPTPTPEPTSTPGPSPTATATIDPSITPTVGTGTVVPGGDPDDGDGDDPRATAPAGDPGDGSGGVTTLPSTGQGQAQSWNGLLQILLLTGLALILLAAGIRQRGHRS
jgi:hypothetical protein